MSAWGNRDDITSPGTATISGLSVSGVYANNFAAGDVMDFGVYGSAVIKSITNVTTVALVSNTELTTGTASGIAYSVSEKPIYTVDTDTNTLANNVYGVSTAEMSGSGGIGSVTVTAAGSGFTVRPTVTITGDGAGVQANTTAKVVTATVGDNFGSGYANGNVVTVAGGTGTAATLTVTTFNGNTSVASLAVTTGGSYTVLPTLDENAVTGGDGSNLTVDLSMGVNGVSVTSPGSGYSSATVAFGGTGGVGAAATAALQSSDRNRASHAGWVKIGDSYTDANGNTRQKAEVLVAMSTITSDADDDTGDVALPE